MAQLAGGWSARRLEECTIGCLSGLLAGGLVAVLGWLARMAVCGAVLPSVDGERGRDGHDLRGAGARG